MKKIEQKINACIGKEIAIRIPNELSQKTIEYFGNNKDLEYILYKDTTNDDVCIDFDNDEHKLDFGYTIWYVQQGYTFITLAEDDFEEDKSDILEKVLDNICTNAIDNRILLIRKRDINGFVLNGDDIYFSEDEVNKFMSNCNPNDYIIIPCYGKRFERTAHISFY